MAEISAKELRQKREQVKALFLPVHPEQREGSPELDEVHPEPSEGSPELAARTAR